MSSSHRYLGELAPQDLKYRMKSKWREQEFIQENPTAEFTAGSTEREAGLWEKMGGKPETENNAFTSFSRGRDALELSA